MAGWTWQLFLGEVKTRKTVASSKEEKGGWRGPLDKTVMERGGENLLNYEGRSILRKRARPDRGPESNRVIQFG